MPSDMHTVPYHPRSRHYLCRPFSRPAVGHPPPGSHQCPASVLLTGQGRRMRGKLRLRRCCAETTGPPLPTPSEAAAEEEEREEEANDSGWDGRLLLVERFKDGSVKRYELNKHLELQLSWEDDGSPIKETEEGQLSSELSWLPNILKDFILPAGFPGSVSDDYLDYMMLQFPTNVTGWLCHTLVTSSLLKPI